MENKLMVWYDAYCWMGWYDAYCWMGWSIERESSSQRIFYNLEKESPSRERLVM